MPDDYSQDFATAAGLASQIYNSSVVAADSKRGREFAREQMNTQRSWALEDWNKQNEYNAPTAQMARFKAAGLNPHLIYGQSQTAAPIRATESAKGEFKHAPIDAMAILGPLMQYMQIDKTRAETDNIKAMKDLIINKTYLTDSQVKATDLKNDLLTDTWYSQKSAIEQNARGLALKNLQIEANTTFTNEENARRALMSSQNMQQAALKLVGMQLENEKTEIGKLYLRQMIKNLQADEKLKYQDIKFNEMGGKNAPWYIKTVQNAVEMARPKQTP